MTDFASRGPDHDTVVRYITNAFRNADVVSALNATFFSLDPEKHWPNFATIVKPLLTEAHDGVAAMRAKHQHAG